MKIVSVRTRLFQFSLAVFAVAITTPNVSQAQARGSIWGQLKADSGEYISFRLNRNNIAGEHFALLFSGECTYQSDGEAPITAENTFSFGGDDFPDLLVQRNGKVIADVVQARSDTGHIGTLAVYCQLKDSRGRARVPYRKAVCHVQFDSPVRAGEQLDSCIGGASFTRIIKGRATR